MLAILVMFWQWLALLQEKAECEFPRGTRSFSVWTLYVVHSPEPPQSKRTHLVDSRSDSKLTFGMNVSANGCLFLLSTLVLC